jgi:hypothetical protein
MAEKVASVGVSRDKNFMYYIKGGDVWRVRRKRPGVARGKPEKVSSTGATMDNNWIHFLDKDGDIDRARRSASSHSKRGIKSPGGRPAVGKALGSGPVALGDPYRRADEQVETAPRVAWEVDPDAVDRGSRAHRVTQNALADFLRRAGVESRSPRGEPEYDLAWQATRKTFVAEVKSITDTNKVQQLRLGLGQVLHYADQMSSRGKVVPVLVVERDPEDEGWKKLCRRLGVILTWPSNFAGLPLPRTGKR